MSEEESSNYDLEAINSHLKHHYEKEEQAIKQLLFLEEEFRDHYGCMKKEMKCQKDWIERLSVLTQKYLLLLRFVCCNIFKNKYLQIQYVTALVHVANFHLFIVNPMKITFCMNMAKN